MLILWLHYLYWGNNSFHYFAPYAIKVLSNNTLKWDLFIWTPLFFVLHFTSQKTLADLKYFFKSISCSWMLAEKQWKLNVFHLVFWFLYSFPYKYMCINHCIFVLKYVNFLKFYFWKIHSFKVYFVWWISCQNCYCIYHFLYRWLLTPFIIAFTVSFKRTLAIVYLIIFFLSLSLFHNFFFFSIWKIIKWISFVKRKFKDWYKREENSIL